MIGSESFRPFNGITEANVRRFLIEPRRILVDLDRGEETQPREMWAFLQEGGREGYIVAFDPVDEHWTLVVRSGNATCLEIIGSETLAGVLDGM